MKTQEIVIDAGSSESQYWHDLWRYRELLYYLSWRDILVRYKQTVIGAAWAILRPLMTMVVLTVVFGQLARMPSQGVPYALLVLAGLLPWQLFASVLASTTNSVVGNANLISKVYFPRIIIPVSSLFACVIDLLISCPVLFLLMAWCGCWPGWQICFLPLFVLLAVVASLGAGLWLAALNVRYRDFAHVVPFIAQFGLYFSPVGFTSSVIPGRWQLLYSLNPMVGTIDGFRWALLGGRTPIHGLSLLVSGLVAAGLLVTGALYYRGSEQTFADVI